MNCKHIQELLPLYVGRDLEEKRAKLVRAHVQSCPECALSVEEYRESQQLLSLFSPPPFSEAVYSGIRQRVLREIGRESTAPAFPQIVASFFRPRMRWAVATALLVAVSVVAFYFIASRRSDRQQVANSPRTEDRTTTGQQPKPLSQGDEAPVASTGGIKDAGTPIAGPVNRITRPQLRKSSGRTAEPERSVPANMPDTASMNAPATPRINDLAEPNAVPARDPATSAKTLRVEMQTRDRNIRIIWFSPQPTKQNSPSKSSKGIQEVRSYV